MVLASLVAFPPYARDPVLPKSLAISTLPVMFSAQSKVDKERPIFRKKGVPYLQAPFIGCVDVFIIGVQFEGALGPLISYLEQAAAMQGVRLIGIRGLPALVLDPPCLLNALVRKLSHRIFPIPEG